MKWLLLSLLVAAGSLGLVVARERMDPAQRWARGLGEGWQLEDRNGEPVVVRREPRGMTLQPGQQIVFNAAASGWKTLELAALRLAEPVALDVSLQALGQTWTVRVRPDEPFLVEGLVRKVGAAQELLVAHRARDQATLSAFGRFSLAVRRDGTELVTLFMGREVLRIAGVGEVPLIPSITVLEGPLKLRSLRLTSVAADRLVDEEFGELPALRAWPRVVVSLAWAAALAALIGTWLAAVGPRRVRPRAWGQALLLALALPSAVLVVQWIVPVPGGGALSLRSARSSGWRWQQRACAGRKSQRPKVLRAAGGWWPRS